MIYTDYLNNNKEARLFTNEFFVKGFKITLIKKPAFEIIGFTRFLYCSDGVSIGTFLKELTNSGQMSKLAGTLDISRQIWVCLSGNEGRPNSDCRCTVCVEKTNGHDFSQFKAEELFALKIPESEWADYEIGNGQSFMDLHKNDVYKMVQDIGYTFNDEVGLHFDNEHEEARPNKGLHFLLPVKSKEGTR